VSLATGQVLQNRYRILGLLGQGGMGAVYLAEHLALGYRCAVKEQIPDPAASPQALAQLCQQFRAEARTLANLDHPNLPRVSDIFSDGGNEYLVMEYVEGKNLADALAEHLQNYQAPLPEKPVLIWMDQVLDALAYLHDQTPCPIIHRDVKPANIILTPSGKVKLVDFGLVKLLDPGQPGTATAMRGLGTPEYTPLEQYPGGASHTDARSDVYALGATMYHLLTGEAPPTVRDRLLNPAALVPPTQANSALTAATGAAILKALEIQPAQRFQTAGEMRQALAASRSGALSQGGSQAAPTVQWRASATAPAAAAPPAPASVRSAQRAPQGGRGSVIGIGSLPAAQPVGRGCLWAAGLAGLVFVVALIAIGLAAQGSAPATSAPTPADTPWQVASAVPAGTIAVGANAPGVFFDEDFSSRQFAELHGWQDSSSADVTFSWAPHQATITVDKQNTCYGYGVPGMYGSFAAVVDLQPVGPGYSEYGIWFRRRDNDSGEMEQTYQFRVATAGWYSLDEGLNGHWVDPELIPATGSAYIHQGSAPNTLAVLAQGPNLSFYINGNLVNTVADTSLTDGGLEFFTCAKDAMPAAVALYRVKVYSADQASVDWTNGPPGAADKIGILTTSAPNEALAPGPTDTPAPGALAAPTATVTVGTSSPGVLFDEDFASLDAAVAGGWVNSTSADETYSWAPHEATITVTKPSWCAGYDVPGLYDNFGVSVDLQPVGPGDSEYAIWFRTSANPDGSFTQLYEFMVTTGGSYLVDKKLNGQWVAPELIPATYSPYIRQGNAQNTLAVLAQGPKLAFYINGNLVNSVTDTSLTSGQLGFFTCAGDAPPAAVALYRVTVYSADRAGANWGIEAAAPTAAP
jgi:serine/threonine-protein kinase